MFSPTISPESNPLTGSAFSEMVDGVFPSGDGCLGESLGELSGYCCFLAGVWGTVNGTVDTH